MSSDITRKRKQAEIPSSVQSDASPSSAASATIPQPSFPRPPLRKFEETEEEETKRFEMELEFLQLLSNTTYLNYLAQNRYFENPTFINYLKYLQYWKKPEYARFVAFPHSLYFLDLLVENERFRNELSTPAYTNFIYELQTNHWRFYRNNREEKAELENSAAIPSTGEAAPSSSEESVHIEGASQ